MQKRTKQWLLKWSSLLIFVLLGAGVYLHDYYYRSTLTLSNEQESITIFIPQGSSFLKVIQILESQEVIDSPFLFEIVARLQGVQSKFKAGEYQIFKNWSPKQILESLVSGKSRLYRFTIPEGLTYSEIVNRLVALNFGDRNTFMSLQQSPALLQKLSGFPQAENLEGFLYPETYFFSKFYSEEQILGRMVDEFVKHYPLSFHQQAMQLGYSNYDILILASMIEKETGIARDRATISSVFHNRLKKNMRLESDPTVIYGIENFDGNLTRKHLKTRHRYNTYTNFGLPPQPIANPGRASIYSALYPQETEFYYFVARGDGSSQFSQTLKEHNRAVWIYQKNRKHKKKNNTVIKP